MIKWYPTVAVIDVASDKMGFISKNNRSVRNYGDRNSTPKTLLLLPREARLGLREAVRLSANLVCEMRNTKAAGMIMGKNSSLRGIGDCCPLTCQRRL